METKDRTDELEARMATLERRVRRLEAGAPAPWRTSAGSDAPRAGVAAAAPQRTGVAPGDGPRAGVAAADAPRAGVAPGDAARAAGDPAPAAPLFDAARVEELLGGRVLAWVGALAVLVGIFFLLVIAVSRGWIGEAERTVLAGLASVGLLAAGVWLHERRGRTDASRAAAATGLAGLFGTLAVAGAVYDLVPSVVALAGALAVGAVATALALRWAAPGIGALGILGALVAPALVGAQPSAEGVALLAVAAASATAVLVHQRWTWLAFASFVVTTPQWLVWMGADRPPVAAIVVVLAAFGALNAAAAAGFELRSAAPRLRIASAVLLVANALVLAGAGWLALSELASHAAGHAWLAGLAAAHLAAGAAGSRLRRVSHELELIALALGVTLGDIAFASVVDGLPVLAGWALSGAAFAALLKARKATAGRGDRPFAAAGLSGHLLLALGHALVLDAPPHALGGGAQGAEGLIALAMVAAGCAVSARLAETAHPAWRAGLDGLGLAVLAYLTAVALEGAALTCALAAEAISLGLVARRAGDQVAGRGAAAFLALALGHALTVPAPPSALIDGVADALQAAVALAAVAAAAGALGRLAPGGHLRAALWATAAVSGLYLASVEIVTPFQPGADASLPLGDLGVRQQGQVLLSALWALAGVGALLAGLARGNPALRRGALALLLATVAKVFLYDLASLTSVYRVASFIVLGLLLLGGAFAWQRVRPRPLPDLRAMPEGLR